MKHPLGRHLWTVLRVLLIVAGVGFIVWKVQWSDIETVTADGEAVTQVGMITLLRTADLGWLLSGLVLSSMVFPLQAIRWRMLMCCRGMNVSLGSTFRLVMVGLFFNFCVPIGANGGDVAKAYGAARGVSGPGSTAKAIISVLMDRVAGLVGLVVLAGMVGLLIWDDPIGRRITVIAWGTLGMLMVGGGAYIWPVTRKWLGVTTLTRLSVVKKIDEAVVGYRHHGPAALGSVLISLPVHLSFMFSIVMAGYALGVPTPWTMLVAVLPAVMLVGALPLTFLGFGVMEPVMFELLKAQSEITFTQVTAMLIVYRAYLLVYAAVGGLLVLVKGVQLHEAPAEPSKPAESAA